MYDYGAMSAYASEEQVKRAVIDMLCAETGCVPSLLEDEGVHVVARRQENTELPQHRRFNPHPGRISAVTMGAGVVVSMDEPEVEPARRAFSEFGREQFFMPQNSGFMRELADRRGLRLYGPFPRFTCGSDRLVETGAPAPYRIDVVDIEARYAAGRRNVDRSLFPNAITPVASSSGRPTVFAAVAELDGEVAGIAGVSRDSDFMWQIGIDVLPEHQGRGLAAALTSVAARAVFDAGAMPYYGASASNIRSMRAALVTGMRPLWVEMLTRPA